MNGNTLEQDEISTKEEIKKPSKYMVVMFNDNITTMEFVIAVLIGVFNKTMEDSYTITMDIHNKGEGVCGKNYSLEIAKEKVEKVLHLASKNNFPLKCEYREQQ